MLDYIAISGNISLYVNVLEQAAAIIVCLDDPLRAAHLASVAEANREESGMLISPQEAAMVDEHLAPARAAVTRGMAGRAGRGPGALPGRSARAAAPGRSDR